MTFRVGQKVACIDDLPFRGRAHAIIPVKGRIYTVKWIGQRPTDTEPGIMLAEHFGGIHPQYDIEYCFRFSRFRPIVESKTDISIFTVMLKPSKVKA